MRKTVSAMEARRRFGELLEDVYRGDEVIIERNGKPMAALVSSLRYQSIEASRERLARIVRETQERTKKLGLTEDEVNREVERAIREVRAAKRKKSA